MLIFNRTCTKGFCKIGATLLNDIANITPKDKSLMIKLTLQMKDKKFKDNKESLLENAKSNTSLDRLSGAGYITRHRYPSFTGTNDWTWKSEVTSFSPRQDKKYIVSHRANGEVSGYYETNMVVSPIEISDEFVIIANNIIRTLNGTDLALYAILANLGRHKNTFTKEDLIKKSGMAESTFRKSWKKLKDLGYLTCVQKATQKGMKYDFALHDTPVNVQNVVIDGDLKFALGKGKIKFFRVSQGAKNEVDGKIGDSLIKDIHSSPLISFKGIDKSSKKDLFDDETKSVLDKVSKAYAKESNSEFISTLNDKLSKAFKGRHINLSNLVIRYQEVLNKFEHSIYDSFYSISGYCNTVIKNDFSYCDFPEMSHFKPQNMSEIESFLCKPLCNVKIYSPKEFKQHKTDNYDYEVFEKEVCEVKKVDYVPEKKPDNTYGGLIVEKLGGTWELNYEFKGLEWDDKYSILSIIRGSDSYKRFYFKKLIDKLLPLNPGMMEVLEQFDDIARKDDRFELSRLAII